MFLSFFLRISVRTRLFLGYVFCFGILYGMLLSGMRIHVAGDTLGFNYPPLLSLQPFSITSLLADPFSGRGFPWFVTYGTLDPVVHILRIFLSAPLTLAWICFIYFVAGAWLFSLWLLGSDTSGRTNDIGRRSEVAAFVGGLIFVCAFFWMGDGDYPLASSLPIFAAMLLFLRRASRHPVQSTFLLGMTVAFGWLAGHFNFIPLILVGAGVYALYLCSEGRGSRRWYPFISLTGGVTIGSVIGLLKLIPALAYVGLSIRAVGLSFTSSSGAGTLHFSGIITALFPYMRLPLLAGDTGGLYFGAVGLALVLFGVIALPRHLRFSLGAVAACLLIALPHSPLYWLLYHLPFFSVLRGATRWLFLCNAAIAVIVTTAFDHMVLGKAVHIRKRIGIFFLCIGCVAAVISIALFLTDIFVGRVILERVKEYFDAHLYMRTSGLPLEHYHRYIEQTWAKLLQTFSLLDPHFLIPLFCIFCTGVFFSFRIMNKWRLLVLVAVTSIAPLFFLHPKESPKALQQVAEAYRAEGIGNEYVFPIMPAFADFMQRSSRKDDVPVDRLRYQLTLLVPNQHALIGVRSIDFYQPIQPTRMGRLLAALGSEAAPAPSEEQLAFEKIPLPERLQKIADRVELLRILNVFYLVSAWELPAPFSLRTSLTPVKNLPPIYIYDVPDPRPEIYAPERVEVMKPDENRVVALLRNTADPDLSFIECSVCTGIGVAPASIEMLKDEPTRLSMDIDAERDTWLVVSRPRLLGWRVTIDGVPVKTAYANSLFFGIPVPAGTHRIDLGITYGSLLVDSARFLFTKKDPWLL